MQRTFTVSLLIVSTALLCACAQIKAGSDRPACPAAEQMEQPELLGNWEVQMQGSPGPIRMELGPHPEWDGTVKGRIHRPKYSSIVVGDVNKGRLTMEESRDGKSVSGSWFGTVVEKTCAREIRGEWADNDDRITHFVMRKIVP